MNPGTQEVPRDVLYVQHTLDGKDCGARVADTCYEANQRATSTERKQQRTESD